MDETDSGPQGRRHHRAAGSAGAEDAGLVALLEAAPELLGAAVGNRRGKMRRRAGEIDAERLCAFAAHGTRAVRRATEALGLGTLRGWCVGGETASWFVREVGRERLVAVGDPSSHPAATLRKLDELAGGGR